MDRVPFTITATVHADAVNEKRLVHEIARKMNRLLPLCARCRRRHPACRKAA